MSTLTKAELEKKVKDLEKKNAELEARAAQAMKEPMPAAAGLHVSRGWLIQTPENTTYEGTTYGVNFKFGMAFLGDDEENRAIVRKIEKDLAGYVVTLLEGEALQALQQKGPQQALMLAHSLMDQSLANS